MGPDRGGVTGVSMQRDRMPPYGTPPDIVHRTLSGPFAVRAALIEIAGKLDGAGLPPEIAASAQIVLAEVLNNVVEHAYGFRDGGVIMLHIWVAEDALWCETNDHGAALPEGRLPDGTFPQIDPQDACNLPEGGFGWALVRELADEITYDRVARTNRLHFRIPHRKVPEEQR